MKQIYNGPVRQINIIDCKVDDQGKLTYTIEKKQQTDENLNNSTNEEKQANRNLDNPTDEEKQVDENLDNSIDEENKADENLDNSTDEEALYSTTCYPEYSDILNNSDIVAEDIEFYYSRRGKLLTKETDFPVTTIEEIPDMIAYDTLVRNKQNTAISFVNPMELTISKEKETEESEKNSKQKRKSIFKKEQIRNK